MFFFKNHAENEVERLVTDHFLLFKKTYKVKASGLSLSFNILRQPSNWYTTKSNCINFSTEIYLTLIFQKRVWQNFPHHMLCMIFQEKCFSCQILLKVHQCRFENLPTCLCLYKGNTQSLKLFASEICKFFKKKKIFILFYCF